jgi:tetratricopeptide (TPR) repeat protein
MIALVVVLAGGAAAAAGVVARPRAIAPVATTAPYSRELAVRNQDIALYQARLKTDPYSAADQARLATLYLQRARETGEYADFRLAEQAGRASVALRGQRNGMGRMALASSLLAQHRFSEAREAAELLVEAEPDRPSYRALLAEIEMELGDYEAAARSFGALEPFAGTLAVAPRMARWEELRGNVAGARTILYQARSQAIGRGDLPREQVAWFHLRIGDFELRNGRPGRAEAALRAGLAAAPGDGRLYGALARLEMMRNHPRRALAYGERAGARADLATLALMGDASAALGDVGRAQEYWRRVEEGYAANPEPFARQWSQYRLDHGVKLPETLALLRQEAAERPDVLGYDMLAWALFQTGDIPGARAASVRALRLGTRDAHLHFHAGVIAQAAGDSAGAREHLKTALKINPNFHPRQAQQARTALRSL